VLAPGYTVIPTVFTVSITEGRPSPSAGTPARSVHEEVSSDHSGSAASEGASVSAGTGDDDSTTAGLLTTPAAAAIVASVAPASAPVVSTIALGVSAGNTGGRAVFGGNPDLSLAGPASGAMSPIRLTGAGPLGPVPVPGTPGFRPGAKSNASTGKSAGAGASVLSSRPSDLLTDFKPFERGALEDAIDRFLAHFGDLGTEPSSARGATDLLTEIMAVAVALTSAKVGLRLFWRPRDDESALTGADDYDSLDPFPGPLDL
jgi:hypothetical protein